MAKYYILAFFSGTVVLALEVLGARILAPYVGTAFFVWVNIIGVILASLSLGYWLGGIVADRNQKLLPLIFLAGAITVSLIPSERALLPFFGAWGIAKGSLAGALLLFAAPSAILGMVSPYIVKLASADLEHLGKTSGGIFAASTLGSIAGTFAVGFWLIPNFTIIHILWGIAGILVILSLAGGIPRALWPILFFPPLAFGASALFTRDKPHIVFEKDSNYYNIRVHDMALSGGRTLRTLLLDGSTQSAKYANTEVTTRTQDAETDFPYTYIELSARLISALKPHPLSMLALGGGGYTIPEYVKERWPETNVTAVEIDPEVTRTAKRFFLDDPDIDIKTVNEDGRVFLNELKGNSIRRSGATFDVIYTDAYSGVFAVPPYLATSEAFRLMRDALAPDGIIILNIASSLEGSNSLLFRSLFKTFADVFPENVLLATNTKDPGRLQNIILAAARKKELLPDNVLESFAAFRYRKMPEIAHAKRFTDDFVPTDDLAEGMVKAAYPSMRFFQE